MDSSRHELLCSNRVFWQKLNAHNKALPEALATHAAWVGFHHNLCGPPAAPIQPDRPQLCAPPIGALEVSITQPGG